jgi:hypothetical protein
VVEESAFQVKTPTIMLVSSSECFTSPMTLPDKPVIEILTTAVAGRDNPEGFGIPDLVDERSPKLLLKQKLLQLMESLSAWSFQLQGLLH